MNGSVTALNGTLVGSSATYSCDLGYSLVGVNTTVCGANGEWSGSVECVGMLVPLC